MLCIAAIAAVRRYPGAVLKHWVEAKTRQCVTNTSASSWCCTEDGRRPPEVGLQEQASNCPVLLRSKGVVVNDCGKGAHSGRQVSVEEMSESKPTDDASLLR